MKSGPNRPLRLETLESRVVPALFGVPWANPLSITASFAPDGTPVASDASRLFEHLHSQGLGATGQREILRAIQTWVSAANLNVGVVGDAGPRFGASGSSQGDIRIGSTSMSGALLASTAPPDPRAGSWAGDILVNDRARFASGDAAGSYDLYTVFLQELGHALGLKNSPSSDSVMFDTYQVARLGLSPSDVEAIQDLYGARQMDAFDRHRRNDSIRTASPIGASRNASEGPNVGDITAASDVDFYRFTASRSGWIDVKLVTSGVSLLTAKLGLYSPSQQLLASRAATDPLDGNLTLRFYAEAGKTYYVRVGADLGSDFRVGTYQLSVVPDGVAAGSSPLRDDASVPERVAGVPAAPTSPTGSDARIPSSPSGAAPGRDLTPLVPRTTLTEASPARAVRISVAEDQLFLFRLSTYSPDRDRGVEMSLHDASGTLVRTVTAFGNETGTITAWIPPGTYTVAFKGIDRDGRIAREVVFDAGFEGLSDSINPYTIDPNYYTPPPPTKPPVKKTPSVSWYYVDLTPLPTAAKPT